MGANLSKIYCIDVESTCWETREEQGNRPNEIIEIGICAINLKTQKVENISSYIVKPAFTTVSEFCTKLTGWTQEEIDEGTSLLSVLKAVGEDYGMTKNHVWFSYGEYDRIKLSSSDVGGSAKRLYNIEPADNPIHQMRGHFNVKTLMALREGLNREMGMERALNYYGLTLEGRHHNGADDAANIAKIVMKVLQK